LKHQDDFSSFLVKGEQGRQGAVGEEGHGDLFIKGTEKNLTVFLIAALIV
jgi:hypothetical protein